MNSECARWGRPLLTEQAVAAVAEYEGTAKAEGNIFIIDHSYILKGTLGQERGATKQRRSTAAYAAACISRQRMR